MFIHDTVIDHIQCGANEIDAVQIKVEIAQLSKKNRGGKTGFEEKFEVSSIFLLMIFYANAILMYLKTPVLIPNLFS